MQNVTQPAIPLGTVISATFKIHQDDLEFIKAGFRGQRPKEKQTALGIVVGGDGTSVQVLYCLGLTYGSHRIKPECFWKMIVLESGKPTSLTMCVSLRQRHVIPVGKVKIASEIKQVELGKVLNLNRRVDFAQSYAISK